MVRPRKDVPRARSTAQLADAQDLRSVISAALSASPVDEHSLRRGVWTFVVGERQAGASPGRVIMSLTELVETATIIPPAIRGTLMHRVILWCVEAYFGHLGGGVGHPDPAPFGESAVAIPQ